MLTVMLLLASAFAFFHVDLWWERKHYAWATVMAILGLLNLVMAIALL
jgi:hypothetical protein